MVDNRIDTPSNTKIVYIYVNSFEWESEEHNEVNLGNPKSKRLYRGVFNNDTKTYRLIFLREDSFDGLFIPKLKAQAYNYSIDATEITLDNILSVDLNDGDIEQLLMWTAKDGNKTLWDKIWEDDPSVNKNAVKNAITKQLRKVDPLMLDFVNIVSNLKATHPLMFDAVARLHRYLLYNQDGSTMMDSPVDPSWIKMSIDHGAGANLSEALQKLARYGGTDRRENLLEEDLLGAIKDLMTELVRRNLHNIDE